MKFWNSISQAFENMEKSYTEWWNSLTIEQQQAYSLYDDSCWWKR